MKRNLVLQRAACTQCPQRAPKDESSLYTDTITWAADHAQRTGHAVRVISTQELTRS